MSLVRAFIAIPLPVSLQQKIWREISLLRQHLESDLVRWVVPENIHLTLKFLGDTPEEKLDKLKGLLAIEMAKIEPFDIEIKKTDAFPNLSRSRVVMIGVGLNEKLLTLQRSVQRLASQIECEPERKRFSPHLTLGRVKRKGHNKRSRSQICRAIEENATYAFGKFRVESVELMQSESKVSGAVYRSLFKVKLGVFFD